MRPALRLFRHITLSPRRAVRLLARPAAAAPGLALWTATLCAVLALLAAATVPFGARVFDCATVLVLAAATWVALLAWASLIAWVVLRPAAGEGKALSLRGAAGLSAALAGWANTYVLALTLVLALLALWDARLLPLLFLPAAIFVGARAVLVGAFASGRLGAGPTRAALAGGLWLALYAPAAAAAGALPARWANRVAQGSMRPTLEPEEIVLVNRLAPHADALRRWDVVVFRDGAGDVYVKRLAGLPGEEITLLPGRVLVDGREVALPGGWTRSPYVPSGPAMRPVLDPASGAVRIRCGRDEYFVLGDNSAQSRDSRQIGPVARRDLMGRAFLRVPTHAADARPGLAFLRRYGAL